MAASGHRWRFFRAGGFDQARLDGGDDLANLAELDQRLWVALSCPTRGLECDEKTLALIDADGDGRIRAPEVLAAVTWACDALKDPKILAKRRDDLAIDAIDGETDLGKRLRASAKQILVNLGKKDAASLSLTDVLDMSKVFASTTLNGDGIVPPTSAKEPAVAAAITDIIACVGSELDRSGAPGLSKPLADKFFKEAEALSLWWAKSEGSLRATVLPLGEATGAAYDAWTKAAAKIEDYFTRCRVAAFDARASAALNGDEAEYVLFAKKDLTGQEIRAFPLARIEPGKALPLQHAVNPGWAATMKLVESLVVRPLLGERSELTESDRDAIVAKLAPYEAWLGAKAGGEVEKLGLPRVRALLEGTARADIADLIAQDEALRPEAEAVASVERLLRYQRDLHQLLSNFVNMGDFYSRKRRAIFQAGTLYVDGRSCDLCIRVADPAAHAALATLSRTFLLYCECTRKGTPDKMTIAAAVTDGHSDNLMVGRNGIFYDRHGRDWDASIVKILEQPISIREAFWLPYKRVAKLISDQIEKVASAQDKELHQKTAASVAETGTLPPAPAAPPPAAAGAAPAPGAAPPPGAPAPFDVARFAGIFAAIGLAVGAIGSALAAVAAGFLALAWWKMPVAIIGAVLLVSGPSMVLAWLKLRQRNLGPMLDATGWAVNTQLKMNIPFGASLTTIATLPAGSERSLEDPFAERSRRRGWWLLVLAVAAAAFWAWREGYVARLIGP